MTREEAAERAQAAANTTGAPIWIASIVTLGGLSYGIMDRLPSLLIYASRARFDPQPQVIARHSNPNRQKGHHRR